jgi:hypothetical protein
MFKKLNSKILSFKRGQIPVLSVITYTPFDIGTGEKITELVNENVGIPLKNYFYQSPADFIDPGFTISQELAQHCREITYISKSNTFLTDYDSFCKLMANGDKFVLNVSETLNIDRYQAGVEVAEFFKDKSFLVQPTGVQGILYQTGVVAQTLGSMGIVSKVLIAGQTVGATGAMVLQSQPAAIIAIPTIGAVFFYSVGLVVGNNTIGRGCNSVGKLLALPMMGVELFYNAYGATAIQKVTGVPTVLNLTKQITRGAGLDPSEVFRMIDQSGDKVSYVKTIFSGIRKLLKK